MARTDASLLETLQGIIERTYDLDTGVRDVGRFVIGDEGYRLLYAGLCAAGRVVEKVGAASEPGVVGARTLVRAADDGGLVVSVYYPDSLIECLERNDPIRRLDDTNVGAFSVLVEELDHLLVIAERYRCRGLLSLLDLELHANVTKYLMVSLFVCRHRRTERLSPEDAAWIQWHLFEKGEFCDIDPEVRARYRDAARMATRYVATLEALPRHARPAELRRFHRLTPNAKIARIGAC